MILAFVRHGETQPNVAGALLGRTDAELTPAGRAQAAALATRFAREPVRAVVSSPLQRARATAAEIGAVHGADLQIDERFIELDYGEWEGLRPAETDPASWRRWRADPSWSPPSGESLTALQARVETACEALARRFETIADGVVVVVSHVSPVKAAAAWALGTGPEIAWRMHLRLASVTQIGLRSGAPFLLTFDETGHLDPTVLCQDSPP